MEEIGQKIELYLIVRSTADSIPVNLEIPVLQDHGNVLEPLSGYLTHKDYPKINVMVF